MVIKRKQSDRLTFNATELSRLVGLKTHQIKNLISTEGLPVQEAPKDARGTYKFGPEAVRWFIERERRAHLEDVDPHTETMSYTHARDRKMSAEAKITELEYAERAGIMANVDDLREALEQSIVPSKARIISLANELKAVVGEDLGDLIDGRIDEALRDLQTVTGYLPTGDEADQTDEAA